jgi:hypothetical protein
MCVSADSRGGSLFAMCRQRFRVKIFSGLGTQINNSWEWFWVANSPLAKAITLEFELKIILGQKKAKDNGEG